MQERSKELIRMARILAVNGEMSRTDVSIILGDDINRTCRFLYKNNTVFNVIHRKFGVIVRGHLAGNSKASKKGFRPFEKLIKDLDAEGRAWAYYDDTFRKHYVLKYDRNVVVRHFFIGHTLNFIMDDFDIDVWKRPTLTEMMEKEASVPVNTFFCSREIKNAPEEGKKEYVISISTGALLLPDGVFNIYCLPKATQKSKWAGGRESRYWDHVNRVFKSLKSPYIDNDDTKDNALVIGDDSVAEAIFKGLIDSKAKDGYAFDQQSVKKIVYIRDNEEGKRILRLLKIPGMQEKVIRSKIRSEYRTLSLETHDAVITPSEEDIKNGKNFKPRSVLFWLDGDMRHLYNALIGINENVLYIICENEYAELVNDMAVLMLKEKAEKYVKITKMSIEEIMSILESKGEMQ